MKDTGAKPKPPYGLTTLPLSAVFLVALGICLATATATAMAADGGNNGGAAKVSDANKAAAGPWTISRRFRTFAAEPAAVPVISPVFIRRGADVSRPQSPPLPDVSKLKAVKTAGSAGEKNLAAVKEQVKQAKEARDKLLIRARYAGLRTRLRTTLVRKASERQRDSASPFPAENNRVRTSLERPVPVVALPSTGIIYTGRKLTPEQREKLTQHGNIVIDREGVSGGVPVVPVMPQSVFYPTLSLPRGLPSLDVARAGGFTVTSNAEIRWLTIGASHPSLGPGNPSRGTFRRRNHSPAAPSAPYVPKFAPIPAKNIRNR